TRPASQIIVVDDASSDGTGTMIAAEFPQVEYIRLAENRGPAAARNEGATLAKGTILAFTDDDCKPPPDWLDSLQQGFAQYPRAAAIGGIQKAPPHLLKKNRFARYEYFITTRIYQAGNQPVTGSPAPGGTNNLAVRRQLFQQIGGFDESFPVAAGEDADLLQRLTANGCITVCLPLAVTHYQTYTWASFRRQQYQRGIGAGFFLYKQGRQKSFFWETAGLLATPALWGQNLFRYRNWSIAFLHAASHFYQTYGRLRSKSLLRQQAKVWQLAASPTKLAYLKKFSAGASALDIGCGAGHYTSYLQQAGFSVTAVDIKPNIRIAAPVIQASLNALPFAAPFDTVICFDVLEHEPNEQQALAELRRITGKRLILSVPNADDSRLIPYNLTFKHHIDKTHQREYFVDELQSKLKEAGFRILALQKEGAVHPAVLAEFLPGLLQRPFRFLLKGLFKLNLLKNNNLMADLYVVVEPDE
ncbi:MAG TPA: glycosyltransferase, partial [Anaerolineae bacterium]|nr:glycosyltransferase [Anaerolineae bacterium]